MSQNKHKDEDEKERSATIGFVTKVSAQYCDKFPLRASIQAIPGLGSSLDTMLGGLGAKWKYERLEDFVSKLSERLSQLEKLGKLTKIEPSEPLFDFMMQTFDKVIQSRSEKKRERFANLVVNQVVSECDWDEAETACRLIADLSDIHIRIIDIAIKAPVYKDVSGWCGVITVEDKSAVPRFFKDKVIYLQDILPSLTEMYISMMCVELLSKSLLSNEGIKYTDTIGQGLYSATDLAKWLMDWISDPGEKNKANIG